MGETERGEERAESEGLRAFRWLREDFRPSFATKRGSVAKVDTNSRRACSTNLLKCRHQKRLVERVLASPSSEVQLTLVQLNLSFSAALACIRCDHFAWTSIQEITEDTIYAFLFERQESSTGEQTSALLSSATSYFPWFLLPFNVSVMCIENWVKPSFVVAPQFLRLDGGEPVRFNGCVSFVRCLLTSESPWTH